MQSAPCRRGKGLAALVLFGLLAACSYGREPAYDAALAGELTRLTAGTQVLFQDLAVGTPAAFEERQDRYRELAAQAETIRLMAEARGAAAPPSGGLVGLLARRAAALPQLPDAAPEVAERLAEYRDATPAYMADYLRNLDRLEATDRAATGDVTGRIAAYEAALEAHRRATEAYLAAFRAWQAGAGPRPEAPAPAPGAPATTLDPTQLALRHTALEDILRDALIYERDILNRNR
jgi:hypothetical protein